MGYFGDKVTGVRQPIALVVDERTTTTDGLAAVVNETAKCKWSDDKTTVANSQTFTTLSAALADMDGYHYTYDPSGSADNIAKADVAVNGGKYDAFYQAIHYNAGIPLTFSGGRRGKWFLPTLGQVFHLMEKFGEINVHASSSGNEIAHGSYGGTIQIQASASGWHFVGSAFWVSTEMDKEKAVTFGFYDVISMSPTITVREVICYKQRKDEKRYIVPFIYF